MVYIGVIICFPSISCPAGDEEMQPYAAHKAHMNLGCEISDSLGSWLGNIGSFPFRDTVVKDTRRS